jgi:tripartite-type tricarboxylate transporter receptor subunit TctC
MKKLLLVCVAFCLVGFLFAEGQTEKAEVPFPTDKTIRLVNPYGAGGGVDRSSRILAGVAPEFVDQRIDVVSMPGAGGQEAINFVMEQPADGYTLLVTDYGPLVTTALSEDVSYELSDWIPVYQITETVPVFFARSDSPIKDIAGWVDALKAAPESLSVGHGRYLSVPHLPLILFENLAGVKNTHVPTTGGSEALAFVLGKKVDLGASVPSTIAGSVKSGDLRGLAVCSAARAASLPDTPTMKEVGYNVVLPAWFTIFAYKDVPAERIEFLRVKFSEAMASPSATALAGRADVVISPAFTRAELEASYKDTIKNLSAVLESIGKLK